MIELKFQGSPQEVLAEASLFVAQLATGGKMIAAAQAQQAQADAAAKSEPGAIGQAPEPMPVAEEVKPSKTKAKKPEAPKPAPVVENVEQTVEDVFDDGPDPAEENQDADDTPKTMEELKSRFVSTGLYADHGKAILNKFSPTGKLSGIPQEKYGEVVKAINAALAEQKAARK